MKTIFEQLVADLDLTTEQREHFKKELDTVFESAVDAKVTEERSAIEESVRAELGAASEDYKAYVEATLREANEAVLKEQSERIERFAQEAAETVFESFEDQFKQRAHVEAAETVVESVGKALAAYKLGINPDVEKHIEESKASIAVLNDRVDAISKEKRALEEQVDQYKAKAIVESLTRDLPQTKREVVESAVAAIKYETDEQYTGAVKSIVENRFPKSNESTSGLNEQKTTATGSDKDDNESHVDENSLRFAKIFSF